MKSYILNFTKETKNTYRYDAPEGAEGVQNIYVPKEDLMPIPPKQIKVTVEVVK